MNTFAAIAISISLAATAIALDPPAKEHPPAEEQDPILAALRAAIKTAEAGYHEARVAAAGDFEIWLEKSPEGPTEPSCEGEIARFTFDSVDQGRLLNAIPRGPAGELRGTPAWHPGKDGNGLPLDRDFRIAIPRFGNFSRVDPFTFGLWIRMEKMRDGKLVLLQHQADPNSRGYRVTVENGSVSVELQSSPADNALQIFTGANIQDDRWHHVAVTFDGINQTIRFYIDGLIRPTNVSKSRLTRDIADDKADLIIGTPAGWMGFRGGVIDDVRIFSRQLSALEVAALAGREDYREAVQMVPEPSPEQRKALFEYYIATSHSGTLEAWQKLHKARNAEREYLEK